MKTRTAKPDDKVFTKLSNAELIFDALLNVRKQSDGEHHSEKQASNTNEFTNKDLGSGRLDINILVFFEFAIGDVAPASNVSAAIDDKLTSNLNASIKDNGSNIEIDVTGNFYVMECNLIRAGSKIMRQINITNINLITSGENIASNFPWRGNRNNITSNEKIFCGL